MGLRAIRTVYQDSMRILSGSAITVGGVQTHSGTGFRGSTSWFGISRVLGFCSKCNALFLASKGPPRVSGFRV